MKQAFVFLATGFEETEAVGTIDVLRHGGINVTIVSTTDSTLVTGSSNITLQADCLLAQAEYSEADALVLPGGISGSTNLNECEPLKELLLNQHKANKIVAAICAAPSVLGGLGILEGRKATCYPGYEPKLIGATCTGNNTETDGNVITGKGPALTLHFGLALVAALRGEAVAEELAAGLLIK
jgi:4-methyl-5(b-hydroxyethyl)-thiazole monophosphate biosynthesis